MSSFNKVILMGNLTRTPELRTTPGGSQVTDIALAVNDVFTDSSGTKQERVTFVDITFWGKQAETLCRWKKKGDPLLVLEAMKMEHTIAANADGTVSAVYYGAGDLVDEGAELIVIEPNE